MKDPSPAAPTVIVARRVVPGREEDFRAWHEQIRAAAATSPGYISSQLQPPDAAHPDEWVTVYSFASAAELDTWLASPKRRQLIAGATHLIDATVREQRIASLRTAPEPVTVVFSQRIVPDHHPEFLSLYDDVADRLSKFHGFLGSDLLPPVGGVQEEFVIVASFASRTDLDRWLESDDRRAWVETAEMLIEGDRTMNVVGGFGGWFPSVGPRLQGPKRWKQAVAVLLALFPTALAVTLVRIELAPDMNVVAAVFVGNVIGVAALSFVLMPLVTRWLRPWLER
jgi:antibiotic biosynthesis monooxygenase (ABM) superfamily enzyme